MTTSFSADVLKLDAELEITRIIDAIHRTVGEQYKRKGAVVGLSGGIDSTLKPLSRTSLDRR